MTDSVHIQNPELRDLLSEAVGRDLSDRIQPRILTEVLAGDTVVPASKAMASAKEKIERAHNEEVALLLLKMLQSRLLGGPGDRIRVSGWLVESHHQVQAPSLLEGGLGSLGLSPQYYTSIQLGEMSVALHPRSTSEHWLALAYLDAGRSQEGTDVLNRVLQSRPSPIVGAFARTALAAEAFKVGSYASAAALYASAATICPGLVVAVAGWLTNALILGESSEIRFAVDAFEDSPCHVGTREVFSLNDRAVAEAALPTGVRQSYKRQAMIRLGNSSEGIGV